MTTRFARVLPLAVAGLLAAGAAGAQTSEFRFSPYIWIAGFDGTVGTAGNGAGLGDRVSVDFGHLSENLRVGGAMLNGSWRRGRWTAFGDWTYAKVTSDAESQWGVLYSGVDAEVKGNIVQGFAGYDLLGGRDVHLDAFAGVRFYDIDIGLDLRGGTLQDRSLSGDAQWADGVVGLRWTARLAERWDAYVQGDVGAGGSNLSWQVIAAATYGFSWGSVIAGWRHLSLDYDDGPYKLDAALSGPLVGVSLKF